MEEIRQVYEVMLTLYLAHPDKLHLRNGHPVAHACIRHGISAQELLDMHFNVMEFGPTAYRPLLNSQKFLLETIAILINTNNVGTSLPALFGEVLKQLRQSMSEDQWGEEAKGLEELYAMAERGELDIVDLKAKVNSL